MNKARLIHPKIHSRRLTEFLSSLPVTTQKLLRDCRLSLVNDVLFICPHFGDELSGNAVRLRRREIWKAMPAAEIRFLYIWMYEDKWQQYDVNRCTKRIIFNEEKGLYELEE